jgi:chromosomal replication initiator protein
MSSDQLVLGDDDRSATLRRAWDRALGMLGNKINRVTFESYIRPIRPLNFQDREVTLGVASAFAREWLDKRYSSLIRSTLEAVLECNVDLRFVVCATEQRPELLLDDASADPVPIEPPRRSRAGRHAEPPDGEVPSVPLNPRYTFDGFIVGRSNRLAHAGALAVGEAPGGAYNPLYIYGGSGLGKTHLMHASGNLIREHCPHLRVAYVDGENFTFHYVKSLREHKAEDFRRYYRNVDVWLVDDVQTLASKEQTKEEFFHTFNALYQTGKQIIITSDRSPRELRTMDERLRTRFECGLIADVSPPDLETRVAIMQARCERENWMIPNEVIEYIASAIQSNVRALEGAVTKLIAYSSIMNCSICIELAQSVLGEYFIDKPLPPGMRKSVTADQIAQAVASRFGIEPKALFGQGRTRGIALARQVAMYLCRELTDSGLAQIGAAFGGRDHTTVMRAIGKAEALLFEDPSLQATVRDVRMRLER